MGDHMCAQVLCVCAEVCNTCRVGVPVLLKFQTALVHTCFSDSIPNIGGMDTGINYGLCTAVWYYLWSEGGVYSPRIYSPQNVAPLCSLNRGAEELSKALETGLGRSNLPLFPPLPPFLSLINHLICCISLFGRRASMGFSDLKGGFPDLKFPSPHAHHE